MHVPLAHPGPFVTFKYLFGLLKNMLCQVVGQMFPCAAQVIFTAAEATNVPDEVLLSLGPRGLAACAVRGWWGRQARAKTKTWICCVVFLQVCRMCVCTCTTLAAMLL